MSVETAEQELRKINNDRQREALQFQEDWQFGLIFKTPIPGRGVAQDNQANRNIILGWLQPGESVSQQWYVHILTRENPALASQLAWTAYLTPAQHKQAESAQIKADREAFEQAAKDTEAFGINDANFNLLRERYSPLDAYQIKLIAEAGLLLGRVSPPSEEEIKTWRRERAEARADYLINRASPDELRRAAQSEFQKRRLEAQQAEAERQIAGREAADAAFGFPPLPETNQHGEKIDAAYLTRISNTNLQLFKNLIRKHGAANVTARLRGIR